MRRLQTAVLAFLLLLQGRAEAGQLHGTGLPPEPGKFDLARAIDEAIDNSPSLRALRERYEADRLHGRQAGFLAPPTVRAEIWQWPLSTLNPAKVQHYALEVEQRIPGGQKRQLGLRLGEKVAAVTGAHLAAETRALGNEIKHAYITLYLARKRRDIQNLALPLVGQMVEATEAKYAGARGSQRDLVKAVTEVTRLHHDLITFEAAARTAEIRLNVLLNRTPGRRIEPLPEIRQWRFLGSPEQVQDLAVERQPQTWAARAAVEQAEAELALARQQLRPDYVVGGGYMLVPGSAGAWKATVGMTWPRAPWSRSGLTAGVSEAQARLEAAKADKLAVEREISRTIYEAYVRVKSAEEHAALVGTTLVPQAQHAFEVARTAYQGNDGGFLDILDNQRTLLAAQLEYFNALGDFHTAYVELEQAVGEELPGMLQPAAPLPAAAVAAEVVTR